MGGEDVFDFIKFLFRDHYVMCIDCETSFRESDLKRVRNTIIDKKHYACAIVCPNCGSKDWDVCGF